MDKLLHSTKKRWGVEEYYKLIKSNVGFKFQYRWLPATNFN